MQYKVVTCFDENKLKQNGSRLLDQFRNNWQPSIEFHCYYYNMDIENYSLPQADNIKYHDLSSIEEYAAFVESNKDHDGTEKGMVEYTELLNGLGAAPKVFAISECAFENKGSWLLWIDPLALNLKDIRTNTLDRYFPFENNEVDFVSIPDNDHLMGFNIGDKPVLTYWEIGVALICQVNIRITGSGEALSFLAGSLLSTTLTVCP